MKAESTSEIVQEDEFDKDRLSWFMKATSTHKIVVMRGDVVAMVIGGSMCSEPACNRCERLEAALRVGVEAIKANLGWEDSEADVEAVALMEKALDQ